MVDGIFPNPGTERGPCIDPCNHMSCKLVRGMAERTCYICEEKIGYEMKFYDDRKFKTLTHAICLEKEESLCG